MEYKHALISPLLKKEGLDADSLGNYQLISKLQAISKIVERVDMSSLAAHVRSSPNYSRFQSAYRRGHSTETAILRMLNDVYCATDNKYRTTVLQLDLSSVFDTLDTSTLLRRLRFTYGLTGPAPTRVSSYLVCHSQSIRVGQKQSLSIICEYGVPQRSVLEPLLFTLYISRLAKVISSFVVNHAKFADDMQLYIALKDDNSIKALRIRAVKHWFDLHGLSMNPYKTEAIVIGTSTRKRMGGLFNTVDLGCVSVSPASNVRSLGVMIDDTLSFNEHVDIVCKSCNFHIRALRHIRRHISEDTAKTIACSMVKGRLDYCNSLSHRTSSSNINKLQRVQNYVACIINRRWLSTTYITPVLHWLPV